MIVVRFHRARAAGWMLFGARSLIRASTFVAHTARLLLTSAGSLHTVSFSLTRTAETLFNLAALVGGPDYEEG